MKAIVPIVCEVYDTEQCPLCGTYYVRNHRCGYITKDEDYYSVVTTDIPLSVDLENTSIIVGISGDIHQFP